MQIALSFESCFWIIVRDDALHYGLFSNNFRFSSLILNRVRKKNWNYLWFVSFSRVFEYSGARWTFGLTLAAEWQRNELVVWIEICKMSRVFGRNATASVNRIIVWCKEKKECLMEKNGMVSGVCMEMHIFHLLLLLLSIKRSRCVIRTKMSFVTLKPLHLVFVQLVL